VGILLAESTHQDIRGVDTNFLIEDVFRDDFDTLSSGPYNILAMLSAKSGINTTKSEGPADSLLWKLLDFELINQDFDFSSVQCMTLPEDLLLIRDWVNHSLTIPNLGLSEYQLFIPFSKKSHLVGGILLGAKLVESSSPKEELDSLTSIAQLFAMAMGTALKLQLETALHQTIQAFVAKQETFRQEEQYKMGREIHDTILQTMKSMESRLGTFLQGMNEKDGGDNRAVQVLKQIYIATQKLLDESTALIGQLRPQDMNFGLIVALEGLVLSFVKRNQEGINFKFLSGLDDEEAELLNYLSDEELREIYRIVQESITNAVKHSSCQNVLITLNLDNQDSQQILIVEIADDGKGFGMGSLQLPSLILSGHYGLVSMQDRVKALHGKLLLKNLFTGGALVQATIPIRIEQGLSESFSISENLINSYIAGYVEV
jgi:signal transduction histidine kinase